MRPQKFGGRKDRTRTWRIPTGSPLDLGFDAILGGDAQGATFHSRERAHPLGSVDALVDPHPIFAGVDFGAGNRHAPWERRVIRHKSLA